MVVDMLGRWSRGVMVHAWSMHGSSPHGSQLEVRESRETACSHGSGESVPCIMRASGQLEVRESRETACSHGSGESVPCRMRASGSAPAPLLFEANAGADSQDTSFSIIALYFCNVLGLVSGFNVQHGKNGSAGFSNISGTSNSVPCVFGCFCDSSGVMVIGILTVA